MDQSIDRWMDKAAHLGYLSLPRVFPHGIACSSLRAMSPGISSCFSLSGLPWDGRDIWTWGGRETAFVYVAWHLLFPSSVRLDWGVYLSQRLPASLTRLHMHQALPITCKPLLQALTGVWDTLASRVSLRGKTFVPKILSLIASLVPEPRRRIGSSKSSPTLARRTAALHSYMFLSNHPPQAWLESRDATNHTATFSLGSS